MVTPHIELTAVTIDCSDAERLAGFYADLMGGKVTPHETDGCVQVSVAGGTINFQRVNSFTPPQWPGQEHPQQFHLDFRVDDVNAAIEHAETLGAMLAIEQPDADHYTVLTDPDGHPFCLHHSNG